MARIEHMHEGVMEVFYVPSAEAEPLKRVQAEINALEAKRQARADALLLDGGQEAIVNDDLLDKWQAELNELWHAYDEIYAELRSEWQGTSAAEVEAIMAAELKGFLA